MRTLIHYILISKLGDEKIYEHNVRLPEMHTGSGPKAEKVDNCSALCSDGVNLWFIDQNGELMDFLTTVTSKTIFGR